MVSLMNWFNNLDRVIWFKKWFKINSFSSIEKVEAAYIHFCAKMALTVSRESLDLFIDHELRQVLTDMKFNDPELLDKVYVDYTLPRAVDAIADKVILILKSSVDMKLAKPRGLSFVADVRIAIDRCIKRSAESLLNTQRMELMRGTNPNEVMDNVMLKWQDIRSQFNDKCLEDILIRDGTVSASATEELRPLFKSGFTPLDTLEDGQLNTKTFLTLAAAPGAGKTRWLCRFVIYPAMMSGKNILFDSLEMSENEIQNLILSIYLNDVYGSLLTDRNIFSLKGVGPDMARIIQLSREELFENKNPKIGRLYFANDTTLSNLEAHITEYKQMNQIDVYCLDYSGFMTAGENYQYSRKTNWEVINEQYKIIARLCKRLDLLAVVLAQFNNEAIEASERGKPLPLNCIEGGLSPVRTTHYLIAMNQLYGGNSEIRNFYCMKGRPSGVFRPFSMKVDLGICKFEEIDISNEVANQSDSNDLLNANRFNNRKKWGQ